MTTQPSVESPDRSRDELLDQGGTWLLDVVSAVDHLRRGFRPGFTVWDAFAEALVSADEHAEAFLDHFDPRADVLGGLDLSSSRAGAALQGALRRWVTTMADRYNGGHHWPHPAPRRGYPPPAIDLDP